MSLELLVEIPQAVSQIIHLGDVANNLGLRAPTVFIMEGGIALVNVSFIHCRKRSSIVDEVFLGFDIVG